MDGADFHDLSEGCISTILSLTSPRATCRSSAVAKLFQYAAASDSVWEKFLPSDYQEILAGAVSAVEFSSKKELYFRLCDPILVDGGNKSFSLQKSSGKKCYMIAARQLSIAWGDDNHYWGWEHMPESRFPEVANLKLVWWLDITGQLDARILSPKTTYAAYLVLKFREDVGGLSYGPANVSVQIGNGESRNIAFLCLDRTMIAEWVAEYEAERVDNTMIPEGAADDVEVREPHCRDDGWMEIELGDFYNDDGEDGNVTIKIQNHDCYYTKEGLVIQGIEVRPKE